MIKVKIISLLMMFSPVMFTSCKKSNCFKTKPKKDGICTMEYAPVCGCDGETYGNACIAEGNGIKTYSSGACEQD